MIAILEVWVFFSYLIASFFYWSYSVKRSNHLSWGYVFALCAIVGHGMVLYQLIDGHSVHNLSTGNLLSQAVWFALVASWLLSWIRWFVPLGLACNVLAAAHMAFLFFTHQGNSFESYPLPLLAHVLLSLMIVSIFLLCVLQATLIGVQNYMMRMRPKSWLKYTWPSLESMEHFLFQMIWVGFCGLTLLILMSLFYLPYDLSVVGRIKFMLVTTSWLVFLGLLVGRQYLGWRGQLAIRWTWSGFALILAALLFASMRGIQ